jgi:hypothetical protein
VPTEPGVRTMTVAAPPSRHRHGRSTAPATAPRTRSSLRSVALPSEHGGWGLTLEPAVLALALVPSVAGLALALAGLLAFLARTPLKLAVVDRRRGRSLPRTSLARRVAIVEVVAIVALGVLALWSAGPGWLVPVALALPLIGVEVWFDIRSRGRRLVPELCGAVGMAALGAAIVVAGDGAASLAAVVWGLLAARSVAAVPWVRAEVLRLHERSRAADLRLADVAQVAGTGLAAAMVAVEPAALAGAVAVGVTAVVRSVALRLAPQPAVRLGAAETTMGLIVVIATAVGLHVGGAV